MLFILTTLTTVGLTLAQDTNSNITGELSLPNPKVTLEGQYTHELICCWSMFPLLVRMYRLEQIVCITTYVYIYMHIHTFTALDADFGG